MTRAVTFLLFLFLSVPAAADERSALVEKCQFYRAENTALKIDNEISYSLKKQGWPAHYSEDLNLEYDRKDYAYHFEMMELFDLFLDFQREIIDILVLSAGSDGQLEKSEFTEIQRYIDEVFSESNALEELENLHSELGKKGFVKYKAESMKVPVHVVLSDLKRYQTRQDYRGYSLEKLKLEFDRLKSENGKLLLEFKKNKQSAVSAIMRRQRKKIHSHLIRVISEKY